MPIWMLFFWINGYDSSLVNAGSFTSQKQCEAMAVRIQQSTKEQTLYKWYCIEVPR